MSETTGHMTPSSTTRIHRPAGIKKSQETDPRPIHQLSCTLTGTINNTITAFSLHHMWMFIPSIHIYVHMYNAALQISKQNQHSYVMRWEGFGLGDDDFFFPSPPLITSFTDMRHRLRMTTIAVVEFCLSATLSYQVLSPWQGRMARGGHRLPKVSPGPTMPKPSTFCGQADPKTALRSVFLWPIHRLCGMRLFSTPLDTLRRMGLYVSQILHIWSNFGSVRNFPCQTWKINKVSLVIMVS
jgi:hypothetical protein